MPTQETPFRKIETTLAQIASDPGFSKGWFVKATDAEGSFTIPLKTFFDRFSEHDPRMQSSRTAFFNECETVVLIIQTWRDDREAIQLLHWTHALDHYTNSRD